MIINKLSCTVFVLVSFFYLLMPTAGQCGQAVKAEDLAVKHADFLNDLEKSFGNRDQDIVQLESDLSLLEDTLRKQDVIVKQLIEDKAGEEIVSLATKQKKILEDRIGILSETKRIRMEMKEEVSSFKKALEAASALSERKAKINDEASLLPASQFESIQKEVEMLGARLESILATSREKEVQFTALQAKNDAARLSLGEEKKKLQKEAEELANRKIATQEEGVLIDNKKRLLENEIRLRGDKANLLFVQARLAKLESQSVQVQKLHIELERDIKSGVAGILSLKFKEAEIERKKKEAEEAKKVEEERRRIAEEEKAKAELEKQKALQKEEIAVQKQLEETSPEKKRILEIEADVHKQEGIIATIKDELITAGTDRHKDRIEFKNIQKNLEEMLAGENTPGEIAVNLDFIKAEFDRIQDKVKTIQTLLSATEKQKAIVNESLEKVRADVIPGVPGEKSNIEKEAEGFFRQDKGELLVELANLRLKRMEEQKTLIESKIDRVQERLELSRFLLNQLADTRERLSLIRAANVWARRESQISTDTVTKGISDIKALKDKPVDLYKTSVQNCKALGFYLSETKNIPVFILKVFIITFAIFSTYFIRHFLRKWTKRKIERFTAMSPRTFFTFELVPGLFRIMRNTLTMFFLYVIALTVSLAVPTDAPVVLSCVYGFAIISVYKLLRGIVVEAVSPYTGVRRWVPVTYSSARHIFKGLNAILIFSVIIITTIFVLNAYSYKKDVIELLWFVYRIVMIFLVIWIAASQRSVLLNMLPYSESALGKLVNKAINILYPLLIAFIILLFAIRSLGYALLTYTFVVTLIKSVIVSIIAYVIYRFASRRLSLSQEHKLRLRGELDEKAFETEKKSLGLRFRVYNGLLDYGILIIAVVIIFGMWNDTFKDVVSSTAAPVLFRNVYENVLYVFVSIKNGLTYKFTLAEGRYTTPYKMLIGILVLVAAFICARYFKNLLQTKVYEKANLEQGARHAISSGVKYFTIGIAAIIGLNVAGIPLRSLTIFAGAFGIGIGFGMQNIINNLVSGIIIIFEQPIKVGDVIKVDADILGKVESINIRSTEIKTFDRTTVVVPNSRFLEGNVVNWIHGGDMILRAILHVGVAYGSNIELVRECLLKVAHAHPDVEKDPEPKVRFAEFGDSALNFQLYIWAHIDKRWMAVSDINFAIDKIFRENNIVIAFPQRDVHVHYVKPTEIKPETLTDKGRNVDL